MSPKIAVIIGVGGQDGRIMWDFLKSKNYAIIGIARNHVLYHNIEGNDKIINILDIIQIETLIKKYQPNEIYYLAAYHHSSEDIIPTVSTLWEESSKIHTQGYFNILHSITTYSPHTKVCYASSCLIYGGTDTTQQNEKTLPVPNSLYGITKLQGMYLGNWFTEQYNLQVVNAILYNHESEFRSPKFVFMKIIQGAINISKGLQDNITLGDISTQVDRGYAGDYMNAMWGLLQSDKKGDYIVSSGKLHTIQDLITYVFQYLDLDRKNYIKTDYSIIQRKKGLLYGDNNKIITDIGRKPEMGFKEMINYILEKSL